MQFRYSAIDTFVQCPAKWYKNYVLGEREEVKSSAMTYGTALHSALNSYFEGEDPYIMFQTHWNSIKSAHLEYDRFSWDDLNSLAVDKFLPNFIRLHSKKFSDGKMEQIMEMPFLGSNSLQGTFDWCGQYEGKLTMLDFKTSAREYHQSKIYRNPQLYIYCALYKHTYGVMPEQIVYKVFIKSEGRIQTLKRMLTNEDHDLIMGNVERICKNMLQMVDNKTVYSNYNCYCKGCLK